MPPKANPAWANDFVFGATADGRQFQCLAIDAAGSIRSLQIIEVPSKLVSVHGAPLFVRLDNGPEFVASA